MPTPNPKFPYLGPDIQKAKVSEMLDDSDTVWSGNCAGRMFETVEKAQIKGCDPGNFRGIDSLENVVIASKTYLAAVSLKTVDTDAPGFQNKSSEDAWNYFQQICWNHLVTLAQFRSETGNLRPATGGTPKLVKVDVDTDGVQVLLLRVGVRESHYTSLKSDFRRIERNLSCPQLGGISPQVTAKTSTREIPMATQIKPLADQCFTQDQGRAFEIVKDATIHGQPPARFDTIDKYVPGKKRIISYKAHDIVNGYQSSNGPQILAGVLKKEIDELASFKSYTEPEQPKRQIGLGDYNNKRLSIGIPMISDEVLEKIWHATFESARKYAESINVTFRVHRVN